ncbi:hypothetical protein EVAR_51138_1 [Eumeta japonica]|uniref:Uncharacterized protein n=1 Tax=Eumeta variegata TaxID=151549 RepID=A0A4C1YNR9_EUMVA|nr:hypothetical protein EVAR_51138_1 [Eumeta japonica]
MIQRAVFRRREQTASRAGGEGNGSYKGQPTSSHGTSNTCVIRADNVPLDELQKSKLQQHDAVRGYQAQQPQRQGGVHREQAAHAHLGESGLA